MASYLPPTEDLPIFDNSVFEINNSPLTFNDAQKGFLAFPYAQGNETFQDIIVDGTSFFSNQMDNVSTMPPYNNATTIVPTTAWVQNAIANAPVNPTITTTSTSSATPLPIPILSTATAGSASIYVDSTNGLTFTPSTNTLTTTTFSGALSGNATSATNVYNSGLTTNTNYPLAYLGTNSIGNTTISSDVGGNHLLFNPSSNTLNISGSQTLSGSASLLQVNSTGTAISCPNASAISFPNANVTATTFTGALSGIATNASNVAVTSTSANGDLPMALLTTSVVGNYPIYFDSDNKITFNPTTNNLKVPVITSSTSITAPIIQTSSNGVLRTYDTGGTLNTSFQQIGTDLTMTIPATGEVKMITQGTGALPSATTDAGTSILWNASAGGGESVFLNYQDSGSTGGFDFYNVSGSTGATKIASIPKTQSAYSTSSNYLLPTYDWVNGTISTAIGSLPGGGALLAGGTSIANQIFTGYNTFNNYIKFSGSYPIYPTIENTALTTTAYVLNLISANTNNFINLVSGYVPYTGPFSSTSGPTGTSVIINRPSYTGVWAQQSKGNLTYTVNIIFNIAFMTASISDVIGTNQSPAIISSISTSGTSTVFTFNTQKYATQTSEYFPFSFQVTGVF